MRKKTQRSDLDRASGFSKEICLLSADNRIPNGDSAFPQGEADPAGGGGEVQCAAARWHFPPRQVGISDIPKKKANHTGVRSHIAAARFNLDISKGGYISRETHPRPSTQYSFTQHLCSVSATAEHEALSVSREFTRNQTLKQPRGFNF